MSGTTLLKHLNSSKRDWRSPIRKMACCLSFLLWLALLQTTLAVNVPGPNGTVVTQILSATSSNPEVKVVEDRDLGKILVYPPQPKEFTVEIIARIMYPDDQYLEKISTVMVGGAGVTIESNEIRNSLILATLKVAPGASGGRFSITYENEDNPNHKGCNVRLLPVEFITPAGDPVAQPKDTGDGQNEFTFDSAKPGVLEINLKVKVAGIGGMSADIQNKFLFEIDAIGNSQMQWDAANPGGKPTFNGDFMTAKVKFTGLPQNNSDFGKKMARIKFDGNKAAEDDFEVFYTGTAKNHQNQANPTYPNWFIYYKQNEGGGAYGYTPLGRSTSAAAGGDATVKIGNEAYNGDEYITTQRNAGKLVATGWSNTNKHYANFLGVLAHERQHATNETVNGNLDPDGDFLSSQFEAATSNTDPANKYSARGVLVGNAWDDGEVYAGGPIEENGVTNANTSQDWANPGSNHK